MTCKTFANRAIAILLCVVMLVGMIPVSVSAADPTIKFSLGYNWIDGYDMRTSIDDNGVEEYYAVPVTLKLTDNSGFITLKGTLTYPETIEVLSVEGGLGGLTNVTSPEADDLGENPITLAFEAAAAKADITATGDLAVITFKVPKETPDVVKEIIFTPTEVANFAGDDVLANAQATTVGRIKVVDEAQIFEGSTLPYTNSWYNRTPKDATVDAPRMYHWTDKYNTDNRPGLSSGSDDDKNSQNDLGRHSFFLPGQNPFMKVYYRTNVFEGEGETLALKKPRIKLANTGVEVYTGDSNLPFLASSGLATEEGEWGYFIVDLSAHFKGAAGQWLRYFHADPMLPKGGDGSLYLDIPYIGFFRTEEEAVAAQFKAPIQITYKNGDETVYVQDMWKEGTLAYPADLPAPTAPTGLTFAGWSVAEGTTISASTTVTPTYSKPILIDADQMTAGKNNSNTTTTYSKVTDAEVPYLHYESAVITEGGNPSKIVANLNSGDISKYPYFKVYYRSNVVKETWPATSDYKIKTEVWSSTAKEQGTDPSGWRYAIIDLSTVSTSFATVAPSGMTQYIPQPFRASYISPSTGKQVDALNEYNAGLDKPAGTAFVDAEGTAIKGYFDLARLGFYSSLAAAQADTLATPVTYMVTFMNGDVQHATQMLPKAGGALVYPEAPAAEAGMGFAGWTDAEGNIVAEGTTIKADTVLYAKFAEVVNVTYMANGKVFKETVAEKGVGLTHIAEVPTLAGHYFDKWDVAAGTVLTEDRVINAVFGKPLVITPDKMGTAGTLGTRKYVAATADMPAHIKIVSEKAVNDATYYQLNINQVIADKPVMKIFYGDNGYLADGMSFGYNTNYTNPKDCWGVTGSTLVDPSVVDQENNVKQWTRTYAVGVEDDRRYSWAEIQNNVLKYLKVKNIFSDGYIKAGATVPYEYYFYQVAFFPTVAAANSYTSYEGEYFLVTYKVGDEVYDAIASTTVEYPEVDPTSAEGKIFRGWADAEGNIVADGAALTADITLTAVFADPATVTFVVDGTAVDTQTVAVGSLLKYPDVTPTKPGYTFIGWDKAKDTVIEGDTIVTALMSRPIFLTASDIDAAGESSKHTVNENVNNGEYDEISVTGNEALATGSNKGRLNMPNGGIDVTATPYVKIYYRFATEGYSRNLFSVELDYPNGLERYSVPRLKDQGEDGDWLYTIYDLTNAWNSYEGEKTRDWYTNIVPNGYKLVRFKGNWWAKDYFTSGAIPATDDENWLQFKEIRFFGTEELARADKLEDKATYLVEFEFNGEIIETIAVEAGAKLGTVPADPGEPTGKIFDGWYDADGNEATADTVITADTKFTALHVAAPKVFDNLTTEAASQIKPTKVEASETTIGYLHFEAEEIHPDLNAARAPRASILVGAQDVSQSPYMKIYYRENGYLANGYLSGDIWMTNTDGTTTEMWGLKYVTHDETGINGWKYVILDISNAGQDSPLFPTYSTGTLDKIGLRLFGARTASEAAKSEEWTDNYEFDIARIAFYSTVNQALKDEMEIPEAPEVEEYTITFVDEDGTELQSGKVAAGETPVYTGETPTKAADEQYTYTFAGWTPEVVAVTGDATYTATFDKTVNEYTVTFYVNGEVVSEQTVAYGEAAEAPADPEIAGKTFTGWDVKFDNITGDLDVKALFDDVLYTVKVQVAAGAGDSTAVIDGFDGDAKVISGTELTLIAEAAAGYIFDGWYNVTGGYSEFLSKDTTATYTVDLADATLEARFVEEVIGAPVVDVVVPPIEEGTITKTPTEDGKIEIKAEVSDETKQVAFWYRETTTDENAAMIYMASGSSIIVPPTGGTVQYIPYLVDKDATEVVVYLGLAGDIISIGEEEPVAPESYGKEWDGWMEWTEGIVTIYKTQYVQAETEYTLTIDYVNAEDQEIKFQVYDTITATKTVDGNVEWVLVIDEVEKVVSNKDTCTFAMMTAGEATLIEREIEGDPVAIISGQSAIYDAGVQKILFSGSYDLPEGATLVGVGVLLADASKVTVQPENINHNTAGIIVGAIKNPKNTNFIINKTKVAAGATWYGRPYLTYTMNGQPKTIYADTMVCTAKAN